MKKDNLNGRPKVVIVGGGFGGLYAAKGPANRPASVTLVDRKNHHTFQPLLYQMATSGLSPGEIATPLRHVLFKAKNVFVIGDMALLTVHVALLGGARSRFMVPREWLRARYTRERSARLITDNTKATNTIV